MVKSIYRKEAITRKEAIDEITDLCLSRDCLHCPNKLYCESLDNRGIEKFEDMTDYQLQHILTELEKAN